MLKAAGRFAASVSEHGFLSTLCRSYTFLESNLLYWLTHLPFVDPQADIGSLEDFDRNNDTVFIMGSGGSVNDISEDEWAKIEQSADTLSFNYFFKGEFIPIDYHIVREATSGCSVVTRHKGIKAYFEELTANPCYDDTRFFVLRDERATDSIWGVYFLRYLAHTSFCPYRNDRQRTLPAESVNTTAHNVATLFDAINLAYLMGYEEVVLVGVDLYDRQYFWLEEGEVRSVDEERDASAEDPHNTANPVIEIMPEWRDYLADRGIDLYVENPQSLLHTTDVLPKYEIDDDL